MCLVGSSSDKDSILGKDNLFCLTPEDSPYPDPYPVIDMFFFFFKFDS